jgi:hypothetical protein
MGRKGSRRNERKANPERVERANQRVREANAALKILKSTPVLLRRSDHDELVRAQESILKKARQQRLKSETHSRTGKKGKR